MNSELRNALEVLKRNCEKHAGENDCEGCDFAEKLGCYLTERVPEDYNLEKLEKFEIESECKE